MKMRMKWAAALMLLIGLSLTGCKDSQEAIAEDAIDAMKEMTAVLETVKDEASAKVAQPKLKKLGEQMQALQARSKKQPQLTAAEQQALKQKYEKPMQEAVLPFAKELMRVTLNPQLHAATKDVRMSSQPPVLDGK
jgi:hypothetical protein